MNKLPEISNIVFHPVNPNSDRSFVGFVSFILDNNFSVNEISVHKRKQGKPSYRLLFPENKFKKAIVCPITKELQDYFDVEISAYIKSQGFVK